MAETGGLSWAQLRDLKCAELEDAADGWGRASNRADAARDRIDKQLAGSFTDTQRGEAATAAVERLKVLSRDFQYIYTECGLVRTTLNSLASELRGPQRMLGRALDDAEGSKFTVHPDGSVSYPAAGEKLFPQETLRGGRAAGGALLPAAPPGESLTSPNPHAARAQEIADLITKALNEARAIDARYTSTLNRLTAQNGLTVTDAAWKDAYGDATTVRGVAEKYLKDQIPLDASPKDRKAWWDGLSQEQKEEYLAVYPDQIGNLDGIPADVRDAANRDNLELLVGKLSGQDDDTSRTQLAALRQIDEQLRSGAHPPMYLLGIGDEGNGRAIVAYGNPDTARNVSAYVPGLGTSLDSDFAKNDLKRARETAIGARGYDKSSASIVWLGYDAPQGAGVMGTEAAERGGSSYDQFMSGLTATNQHENPHLTAIGHSYGSRTVGAASQHAGGIPGADDIILVGSPGVGVDRAEELGVGKEHVFVGAAENDLVTKLPSKQQTLVGGAAMMFAAPLTPVLGDLADPGDDDLWFGRDPASAAFGAKRFEVAEGPKLFTQDAVVPAHSNYFDPNRDAKAADNIALIVAGESNDIAPARRR